MTDMKIRTTRIHLTPDDILNDRAFSIEIDDEGGGEFIAVRNGAGHLDIDIDEWPELRNAIDFMIENVRVEE